MLDTKVIDKMSTTFSPTQDAPAVGTADSVDPSLIIEQRQAECLELINKTASSISGKFCEAQFDGWTCWSDTKAGTSALARCPDFIQIFDKRRYAHKFCDIEGNWFRHPETNRTWSNYTTCVDVEDFELRHRVNLIYEIGYSISLIAILLSIFIFCYFRSLKCSRITLHMNLFTSFAVNNCLWLIWYRVILGTSTLRSDEQSACVFLHLILHYFLLTNYAWMLCEGFYLHTVLVSAFVSEKKLVRWLIVLGWTTPAVFLILYGVLRGFFSEQADRIHCWMDQTPYIYVLVAPVCLSMLLNLLFLCNIVRVLLIKLNAPAGMQAGGPSRTILQAFRATLLLVPLLGLQYMLTPFRPSPGHQYEEAYEIISAFTASFQGLCVAILFCFCNGEVIAQFKRKWRVWFFRPRANSYTATQVSFVVRCSPSNGENGKNGGAHKEQEV